MNKQKRKQPDSKVDTQPEKPSKPDESDLQIRHLEQIKFDIRNIKTWREFTNFIRKAGPFDLKVSKVNLKEGAIVRLTDITDSRTTQYKTKLGDKRRDLSNGPKQLVNYLYSVARFDHLTPDDVPENFITVKVFQQYEEDEEPKIVEFNLGKMIESLSEDEEPEPELETQKAVNLFAKMEGDTAEELTKIALGLAVSFCSGLGIDSEKAPEFFTDVLKLSKDKKYH